MEKDIEAYSEILHLGARKNLQSHSIYKILRTQTFRDLWAVSSKDQKIKATTAIRDSDIQALETWMDKHPSLSFEDFSIRKLRVIARRMHIRNYSRLSRVELVTAIRLEGTT